MTGWAWQPGHRWRLSVQEGKRSIKLKIFAAVKRFRENLFAQRTFLFFPLIPASRPELGKSREPYLLAELLQELF
jgi:hypothetical protein